MNPGLERHVEIGLCKCPEKYIGNKMTIAFTRALEERVAKHRC